MKKIALLLAVATAIGPVLTSAADARPRGRAGIARGVHGPVAGYRRRGRNAAGAAAVAGIAGALIGGAAIAASQRRDRDYDDGGYGSPAYGPGPVYYDGY